MFGVTTVSEIKDGELGLGSRTLIPDFTLVVPFIGDIFTDVLHLLQPKICLRYGFTFWPEDRKRAQYAIDILKRHLPKHVHFYTVNGQELFDIKVDGKVTGITCYLIGSR